MSDQQKISRLEKRVLELEKVLEIEKIIDKELSYAKSQILERIRQSGLVAPDAPSSAPSIGDGQSPADPQVVADEEREKIEDRIVQQLSGQLVYKSAPLSDAPNGVQISFLYQDDQQLYTSMVGNISIPTPDEVPHPDEEELFDREALLDKFKDAPLSVDEIDEMFEQLQSNLSNTLAAPVTDLSLYLTVDGYSMWLECRLCAGRRRKAWYSPSDQRWICTIYSCGNTPV